MGIPITTKYPKWSKGNVIITQPGDITLHDMLELPTTTPEQVKSVIFQLLYLLYVFNKFNISHGDCHFNNIFVMRKPEKITLTYKINGKHYQLVTDRLLKIYDFDHTLIAKDTVIPINNKIQPVIRHINMRGPLCEDWAECPTFNDKLDLGIIYVRLAILANTVHRQTVKDIVKELLPVVDPTKTIGSTLVRDTLESLSSKEKKRLKDLGFKSRDEMVLGTDVVILNNTWLEYIRLINSDTLRRIVRSLDSIPNNQLYIPDSVMTPIETFWKKTSQFNSYLLSDDKIPSVQTSIIYTVDGV
jgi:hypothetical protein